MEFIKLEEPIIYEHKEGFSLTVIDRIAPQNIKYGQITCKGKTYDFDDGEVVGGEECEVVFDLTENVIVGESDY